MAAGAVDVTVAAAPDEVWEKVGDFGGVGGLLPRHRVLPPGGRRPHHRHVRHGDPRAAAGPGRGDPRPHLLGGRGRARSRATPPPSRSSPTATGSKVIWAYDVTPDEMAPIFGDTYKGALAALESAFS